MSSIYTMSIILAHSAIEWFHSIVFDLKFEKLDGEIIKLATEKYFAPTGLHQLLLADEARLSKMYFLWTIFL